jgi:hypothetical protein
LYEIFKCGREGLSLTLIDSVERRKKNEVIPEGLIFRSFVAVMNPANVFLTP